MTAQYTRFFILPQALHLALRGVIRQPRRTAISVAAVAFGIVALMLASGFIEWIFDAMRETTIRVHLGHLQIVRPGFYEAGRADPYRYLLPTGDDVPQALRKIAGVENIAPRLNFAGLASHGDATLSFIGEAVDPDAEGRLSEALAIIDGAALAGDDAQGVLFGVGLARNLGVNVGDRVVLLVNTASGGVNALETTVRGLFSTSSKAYDDGALRITIGAARKLLRVRGQHAWFVLLDDTRRTDAVLNAVRAQLPAQQYQATPWYELADFYNKTVTLFNKQVGVMWAIVAVIIVLSITNTMMMSVIERTWEVGTAMALGNTRRHILNRFILEGCVVGVVGGVLGVVLAYALGQWISWIGIPMPPPPGMAHGYIGHILLTPALAVQALVLAVVTTIVASLYPAWKASRLQIVDALRHNR